jgi:hypothetical protein
MQNIDNINIYLSTFFHLRQEWQYYLLCAPLPILEVWTNIVTIGSVSDIGPTQLTHVK